MPQVFGESHLGLLAVSSFWVHGDYLDDVAQHEDALANAGFDNDRLPVNLDKSHINPRGQIWGQHLRTDNKHHYWAIVHVANPQTDPNFKDNNVGGRSRYSVQIHAVPRDITGKVAGSVTQLWDGNDINKFLNGTRRSSNDIGRTWPDIQKAMQKGPRR